MAAPRVLFFGASGQAGQAFRHVLGGMPSAPTWEMHCPKRSALDMTDSAALRDAIQALVPDLIVNAAGIGDVDAAEKDELRATKMNFHAVAEIAAHACALDIPVIHLSSSFVFDGTKTTPYVPDDLMNPINQYGAGKVMGEESLRHGHAFHVIVRTPAVFSRFGDNALTRALKMIETQQEIKGRTDRVGAPLSACALARALIEIAKQILDGKTNGFGTFHLCGTPACSSFEWLKYVMQALAPHTAKRPALIEAECTECPSSAKQPVYSVLDCQKIKDVYGIDQPDWREHLDEEVRALIRNGER